MANLYKDADKRRRVAPGGAQKTQEEPKAEEVVTTPAEPEIAQEAPSVPVSEPITEQAETPKVQEPAPAQNLLDTLIIEKKKPSRATYGFYLDDDIHEAIVKAAKKNKVSKSEIVNKLLRRAIFGE